ncbi:MAG TPA: HAMP domain-containing sensor histidine kinase [Methanospirillum sp.]|nr:HAMP domain-containing sensor histidine kinase [Methanospirillum sp.]
MMKHRIGLLYCGSLSTELETALSGTEFPDLITLPYQRHCSVTRQGWDPIEEPFRQFIQECTRIIIIGCGCMTTIIPPEISTDNVEITIPNLFSDILLPEALVASYLKEGAYLIVPENLTRWEDFFTCQGFDPDSAKMFVTESVQRIICVDMLDQPDTRVTLDHLSRTLGIPVEHIPVGIAPLRRYISDQYQRWQTLTDKLQIDEIIADAHRKSADYAMMIDLLGEVTTIQDEGQVIEKILDLFTLLFSPHEIGYFRATDKEYGRVISRPEGFFENDQPGMRFFSHQEESGISDSGTGFFITIIHDQVTLGMLALENLAVPERIPDYLDISQFISKVCALALVHARRYQQIETTVKELGEEVRHRRKIEEALHLASKKLNLLSSITRHDILNSLNALLAYLDFSRGKVKDNMIVSEYIEKEILIAETIQHQIEFTRYYEEIGISAPEWKDISGVINRAASSLKLQDISLEVQVHGLAVFCDSLIEKVFYNLFENTLRHGEHVTAITISSSLVQTEMILVYTDDGVGVAQEDKDLIFEQGFGKNTGFGMFLTKEILSITGISIQETGVPGEGVQFEMVIPEGKFKTGN